MDFLFKCPNCSQELEVDTAAAGATIDCPTCAKKITIPEPPEPAATPAAAPVLNPMASSAAAKEEKHFSVPIRNEPTASLIQKPPPPLEVTAKETGKSVRVKTIKHGDCVEVGKDKFDDIVSAFLDKIGPENVVSITTINYSHTDVGTRAQISDFGVMIVYKA